MEKKLKSYGLVVECAHLPETVPLLDELEDASKRGVLFGIIISSQHEVHRSVTVHILHGTQQGKLPSICVVVALFSPVYPSLSYMYPITLFSSTFLGIRRCENSADKISLRKVLMVYSFFYVVIYLALKVGGI